MGGPARDRTVDDDPVDRDFPGGVWRAGMQRYVGCHATVRYIFRQVGPVPLISNNLLTPFSFLPYASRPMFAPVIRPDTATATAAGGTRCGEPGYWHRGPAA